VDEYELNATTATSLMLRASASDGTGDDPVVLGKAQLWDGTIMRRPSQAIAYLKEQAEADPTNGAAWRRLGNIQERLGLDQDALLSWRKAIEVDDKECEAASSLASASWQQGDVQGALDALSVAIERFDRTPGDLKETVAGGITSLLPRIASLVDGPLGLDVAWTEKTRKGEVVLTTSRIDVCGFDMWQELAVLLGGETMVQMRLTNRLPTDEPRALLARLGRRSPTRSEVKKAKPNEKCPCGSGRKHKKCCGRAW
jgi:tetratricopeptide (TPR) repeat protein